MLASMTAFAREKSSGDWGSATLEIKTVNHRYLEIGMRLPEDFRMLEPVFRGAIQQRIGRGKVDCCLKLDLAVQVSANVDVNLALAKQVVEAANKLPINHPQQLDPMDILRWPGVTNTARPDVETLERPMQELLNRTLDALVATREREGGRIREVLLQRCESLAAHIVQTRERLPEIVEGIRTRYLEKARESSTALDNDRLEQEILILVQKMDVAEELERLEIHRGEVVRVLDMDEPVGRRLDFLMQEMNREANTLSSKSVNIDTSNASVELKVLIEQMREQIQNVE